MSQGRKAKPEPTLFVPACELYAHIPKKHFYEQLDGVLDLSFVYELTKPLYAEKMGRPSLDPVIFFKCMLVGFFENITYDSDRPLADRAEGDDEREELRGVDVCG